MTTQSIRHDPQPVHWCRGIAAVAIASAALTMIVPRTYAASDTDAAAVAGRNYVVFFGLNVFADDQGNLVPVVGATGSKLLVQEKGKPVEPRREGAMAAVREAKLSRSGVMIEALTGTPVYSPANNPLADAQSQLIAMQNITADRQEASEGALREAESASLRAAVAVATATGAERAQAVAGLANANANVATATNDLAAVVSNPQFKDFLPGSTTNGATTAFDGFEVTFRVSAPEPLDEAYGVLRLLLRPPGPPKTPLQQALKVFRLPPLETKPRKVIVRRFDLPKGATIESYEIHVYRNGYELATNLSQNRVELTPAEALQFLILQHVQRHAGKTIPAEVAELMRPVLPRSAKAAEWSNRTLNLSIGADGNVDDVAPGAGTAATEAEELYDAVRHVRFLPALVNGQPAASTGTFAVGEMFLSPRQP